MAVSRNKYKVRYVDVKCKKLTTFVIVPGVDGKREPIVFVVEEAITLEAIFVVVASVFVVLERPRIPFLEY